MKKIDIITQISVYDSIDLLPDSIKKLFEKAVVAREKAYAPYSNFKVGAALLLSNNETITASNQENAAYPSGLCAERVGIFYAGAQFPDQEITHMAITARSHNQTLNTPIPPCGACRQSIAEYEIKQQKPIAIYFMGETGPVYKTNSIKDLLPLLFDGSSL